MRGRLFTIAHAATLPLRNLLDEVFPPLVPSAPPVTAAGDPWQADTPDAYCVRCGQSAGPGAATLAGCSFCLGKRFPWHRVTRLGPYDNPLQGWITAAKFRGEWPRARWLGRQLALTLGEPIDPANVVVCPVPMHFLRRAHRGYDQAFLMAHALAHHRAWPLAEPLRRARWTPPQVDLSPAQRRLNVRHAFALRRSAHRLVAGREVVVVDDVMTTGATLRACARHLRTAGARTVHLAIAAVAARK